MSNKTAPGAKGLPQPPDFSGIEQFTRGQNLNRVRDKYADLGLGGSTMEAQDLAGANLASTAQGASLQQLAFQDALQSQQVANAQSQQTGQAIGTALGAGLA